MPVYKLTYFDVAGLAESIRWVFKVAKQEFEDERIPMQDFEKHRSRFPVGKIPVLLEDDVELTQSNAIGHHLCRKFGFISKDDLLQFRSSEIVEIMDDVRVEYRLFIIEKDAEKREERRKGILSRVLPIHLKQVSGILKETRERTGGSGGFIAGDQITFGDFILANYLDLFQFVFQDDLKPLLDEYPNLLELAETVWAVPEIKEWLKVRPPYPDPKSAPYEVKKP